jgi:hypothetical protein
MTLNVLKENEIFSNINLNSDELAVPVMDIPYFIRTNSQGNEYEYVYNILYKGATQTIDKPKCIIILGKNPHKFIKVILKDKKTNAEDIKEMLNANNLDTSQDKYLKAGLLILGLILKQK